MHLVNRIASTPRWLPGVSEKSIRDLSKGQHCASDAILQITAHRPCDVAEGERCCWWSIKDTPPSAQYLGSALYADHVRLKPTLEIALIHLLVMRTQQDNQFQTAQNSYAHYNHRRAREMWTLGRLESVRKSQAARKSPKSQNRRECERDLLSMNDHEKKSKRIQNI